MPFKSQAQRRLFLAKLEKGEITQATFDEWDKATKGRLPETVAKKTKGTYIKEIRTIKKKVK